MDLDFKTIEEQARRIWAEKDVYKVVEDANKPKYYVLDMFPYPSGAGLHVGHPLGYIASDIVARYKRLKGFNVLHPMGFDAFGLPAEQYAIQTGQHPAITTEKNIETYRKQLDKIGFSFDWSREVRTNDSKFYKWTQWIFLQLFKSWYNKTTDRAEPLETLIKEFETKGNAGVNAASGEVKPFSSAEWKKFSEKEQQEILMGYRLAFLAEAYVNWCPALGTVLANDEVKDGVSERGGYPVERKLMKQWMLRITAYSERLLNGLDTLDWSESMKEAQRNWIGKSEGCSIKFKVKSQDDLFIEVFSTRPDTIFGTTFITLAPEHELIEKITLPDYKAKVDEYVHYAKNRSERERQTEVKKITGQFTGAYVLHPFTQQPIPVWIGEYVLAGYGTGAVMGVPGHDQRDWDFANYFNSNGFDLPIVSIIKGINVSKAAYEEKNGILANSDFLNGLNVNDAIKKAIDEIQKKGIGKRKVNYKQRDAVFGRQRYWGEPIPIYYKDGIPYAVEESDLPIVLPEVDKFLPTETGEPPLARAKNWKYKNQYEFETTTMPGWAGSSWYFLRYMDPHDDKAFASKQAMDYWKQIDLYVGGNEHATGHLLYFRFWTKNLKDRGLVPIDEPAKKLVNQGMIQGLTAYMPQLIFKIKSKDEIQISNFPATYISQSLFENLKENDEVAKSYIINDVDQILKKYNPEIINHKYEIELLPSISYSKFPKITIPIKYINEKNELDIEGYRNESINNSYPYEFISEPEGKFMVGREPDKMSKRYGNVINPDEVIAKYGADCFRMYEMFLGPVEMSKPWDTKGIDGVSRFLRKFWKLFYDDADNWVVTNDKPTDAELKILYKTIKKVAVDMENLSFNTSVSAFMICLNELAQLNCHKKEVLGKLLIILSPFAPYTCEYLWQKTGNKESIVKASFPGYDEKLLVENTVTYPVAVNGKVRTNVELPADASNAQVEEHVMKLEQVVKWLDGKQPKKVIVVKGKMVNVVV
jgi:leucyl-tRNA synthetase